MWKIYVGDQNGVAIKSTIGRLKRSIDPERRVLIADLVSYIDHENGDYQPHPTAHGFERFFSKSHFYSYEKEFRIIYQYPGNIEEYEARNSVEPITEKIPPSTHKHSANTSLLTAHMYQQG